jgi:hypothetical protein
MYYLAVRHTRSRSEIRMYAYASRTALLLTLKLQDILRQNGIGLVKTLLSVPDCHPENES